MDWADELAAKIWHSPGGNKRLRACIAKVLRDVQRETAEECAVLAEGTVLVPKPKTDQSGCGPSIFKQKAASARRIRETFGLKEPR